MPRADTAPADPAPGRSVPRWVVALAIIGALGVGAAAAFGATHLEDDDTASAETSSTASEATVPAPVTLAPGTDVSAIAAATTTGPQPTTLPLDSLAPPTVVPTAVPTVAATTEPPPVSPVIGDHMVFHDGVALGQVTPAGFVPYVGDPAPQLRQGEIQVTAMSTLIESRFLVQVRPLGADEEKRRCPAGVQPRPATNAYPVGLWVESPTWTFAPTPIAPLTLGPDEASMVQTAMTAADVVGAPAPTRVQVVSADLAADGAADTVIAAAYRDDSMYYRLVIVAADGDPARVTTAFFEQGPSTAADGTSIPESDGTVTVDAIAELTGFAPYELVVRVRGGRFAGATVRAVDGTELASWACPV